MIPSFVRTYRLIDSVCIHTISSIRNVTIVPGIQFDGNRILYFMVFRIISRTMWSRNGIWTNPALMHRKSQSSSIISCCSLEVPCSSPTNYYLLTRICNGISWVLVHHKCQSISSIAISITHINHEVEKSITGKIYLIGPPDSTELVICLPCYCKASF